MVRIEVHFRVKFRVYYGLFVVLASLTMHSSYLSSRHWSQDSSLWTDEPTTMSKGANRYYNRAALGDADDTLLPIRDRISNYFQEMKTRDDNDVSSSYNNMTWLEEYLYWHDDMRRQFPGYSIFEHPDAPQTAICYLTESEGVLHGLTDRLKDIGHLLRLCHEERRVLFYAWYDAPLSLESFLVPNLFNWSLPEHPNTKTAELLVEKVGDLQTQQAIVQNINTQTEDNPKKIRIYENGRPSLGEYLKPFHVYWYAYFRPSPAVQTMITEYMHQNNLSPKGYDAVHMRVGHPIFRNQNNYNPKDRALDYYHSKCTGEMATLCMEQAAHAIDCAAWLGSNNYNHNKKTSQQILPIYFYSDSPELIKMVVKPSSFLQTNTTSNNPLRSPDQLSQQTLAWSKLSNSTAHYPARILGRSDVPIDHVSKVVSNHIELAQIFNQTTPGSFDGFASTFVDLYIASQARCVNVGVGRYSYLAAIVGGVDCWSYHHNLRPALKNRWGLSYVNEIPQCPLGV